MKLSRRSLFACAALAPVLISRAASAQSAPVIHVIKGRGCGCCAAWVNILKGEGFSVTDEMRHPADLVKLKMDKGIPQNMFSRHTAMIDGYIVEGHVPPADIRRLISEKPYALGIAVPEMPYGSPGMGLEDEREAFDVFLFRMSRQFLYGVFERINLSFINVRLIEFSVCEPFFQHAGAIHSDSAGFDLLKIPFC